MDTLIDALTQYADENLIPRLQQEIDPQIRAACRRAEELTSRLESLSPQARKWTGKLRNELSAIDYNNEQAALLAGISIGLELGRL